ncbi:Ku protein [Umezawaea sp. NPDC059074]|uniref:non-homologous end joining protein Ku n=1 Tax=Umezawaea sp. NPDC059074 TaxID=3346716 RepID=UPI00367465FF
MARAIWSGAISFGLVTIPVALYSATHDHTVHFNQFERGTSDRIRYQRINERTGEEVDYSDVVKGHDVGGGEYVVVEQEELDDIAPGRSRTIDIDTFVDLAEIDPVHFQKSYWLGPAKAEYARPYRLLVKAMAKTGKAGIATFVMRGKQYLTALHADGDLLALETLFFADEIRDPADVLDELPSGDRAKPREVAMATALIESMSGPWRPEDFHDTYTAKVEKLVRRKQAGKKTITAEEPPDPTEVVDLMEALRRSVEGTRKKPRSTDLSDLSKADLTKRARQLGVKGRSKMTRAALEKAIHKAS